MHSGRGPNGWSSILGESAADNEEKTDPEFRAPEAGAPQPDVPDDPVLRAMAEMHGNEVLKNVPASPPPSPTKPPPKLSLGAGPSPTPKLKLPSPTGASSSSARAPSHPRPTGGSTSQPAEAPSAFSSEALLDQLGSSSTAPAKSTIFTKEVVATLLVGILFLAGAILWTRMGGEPKEIDGSPLESKVIPVPKPPPPLQKGAAQTPGQFPSPGQTLSEPDVPKKPLKPAPMLSIVSVPLGALVEIDGAIYGKTPLIRPAPSKVKALAIVLKKDRYRKHKTVLTPDEAGHFTLNVKLEPVQ